MLGFITRDEHESSLRKLFELEMLNVDLKINSHINEHHISGEKFPDGKLQLISSVDAIVMFCPITKKKCKGEDCMKWSRDNENSNFGYCGY